jgi:hypothetical protein
MRSCVPWARTLRSSTCNVYLGASDNHTGAFDSRTHSSKLFGAKVLVRPFTERAVTVLYLFNNPNALQIWNDGWKHGKRPTLQQMVEHLNQKLLQGFFPSLKGFTHDLNSATHGDPLSARWNVVLRDDEVPVFLPSKNLHSPGLTDEICAETIPWLAATMGVMSAAFGQQEKEIPVG